MWSRGEYFEQKNRRIVEQFKDEGKLISSLFQGVIVYIDGQTKTPYQELRKIICDNGGQFEPNLYKAKITHFVAENVSHAKLLDLQSKRNLYIVKPEWITDSVKAGKRLRETAYSLIRLENGIDNRLQSRKERREEAVKESYVPEKVFQKSRFHMMDVIKKKLQDQVNENYNSNNQPIPMDPGEDCIYAHIDMDCYFVQIALLNAPQYQDQPVAVSSGESEHSEVSSCNYKAREFGVTKGMWMKRAKDLCPSLIILPYDFDRIETTSQKVVSIVLQYTSIIQVGSCDEIYCDLSFYKPNNQFLSILQSIKMTIKEQTGCTCTIGCSHNLLMARIATAKAKPDGFLYIPFSEISSFLLTTPIGNLPGVGTSLEGKLHQLNIQTCQNLLQANSTLLSNTIGEKTATQLLSYASGQDTRILSVQSNVQSIGVQVSYGVRCQTRGDVVKYICSLCNMLVKKLQAQNISGMKLTAKFYKKIPTEETAKFMGHGPVTIINLSHTNGVPIAQYETLLRLAVMLYDNSHIQPEDIRGIGLLLKNLVSQKEYSSIQTFFSSSSHTEPSTSPSTPIKKQSTSVIPSNDSPNTPTRSPSSSSSLRRKRLSPSKSHKPLFPVKQANTIQSLLEKNQQVKRTYGGSSIRPMIQLPSLQELDLSVFQTLPEELQREMAGVYLQKEKELTEEQLVLFQKVVNHEVEDHEITTEERELRVFVNVIVKPLYSLEDRKIIIKYMKEYELNSELEIVLEEIMKEKSKEDIFGAKELVCILENGIERSGDDSWKSIVDRLSCIYEESLNSI